MIHAFHIFSGPNFVRKKCLNPYFKVLKINLHKYMFSLLQLFKHIVTMLRQKTEKKISNTVPSQIS